jgi:hypothetical protein
MDASPPVPVKAMSALQAQDLAAVGHGQGSTCNDHPFNPDHNNSGQKPSVDALTVELERMSDTDTPRPATLDDDMAAFLDKKKQELDSKGPWHPLSLSNADARAPPTATKPSKQETLEHGDANNKEGNVDGDGAPKAA